MNASDAKESITKVASLKERMAALQGRGGFAGGSAPPPIKPGVEKPKWKPPPQVVATPPVEGGTGEGVGDRDADVVPHAVQVPESMIGVGSGEEAGAGKGIEEEKVEVDGAGGADPGDEERQRRAAIAARMARLGGARVGMAPMFGRPPVAKKPEAVVKPAAEDVNVPETPTEGKHIFIWGVPRLTGMFPAATTGPVTRSSSDTLSVSSSGMFASPLRIALANPPQRNPLKEKTLYPLPLLSWKRNTATILLPCPCRPLLGELDHRERRFPRPLRSLLLK